MQSRKALYLVLIDCGLPLAGHFSCHLWGGDRNGNAETEKIQADKIQGKRQPL